MLVQEIILSRVKLRPYCSDDLANLQRLFGNRMVMKHTGGQMSAEKVVKLLDRFSSPKHPDYSWVVELTSTDEYIGHAALRATSVETEYELAVLLLPVHWQLGYGAELMEAIRSFGSSTESIKTLIATIDPEHIASRRLAEKVGLRVIRWEEDDEGKYPVYSLDI